LDKIHIFNDSTTLTVKPVYTEVWINQNPYIEEEQTTQWSKEKQIMG